MGVAEAIIAASVLGAGGSHAQSRVANRAQKASAREERAEKRILADQFVAQQAQNDQDARRDAERARQRAGQRARQARGYRSTILTSSSGLTDDGLNLQRNTLLGQ